MRIYWHGSYTPTMVLYCGRSLRLIINAFDLCCGMGTSFSSCMGPPLKRTYTPYYYGFEFGHSVNIPDPLSKKFTEIYELGGSTVCFKSLQHCYRWLSEPLEPVDPSSRLLLIDPVERRRFFTRLSDLKYRNHLGILNFMVERYEAIAPRESKIISSEGYKMVCENDGKDPYREAVKDGFEPLSESGFKKWIVAREVPCPFGGDSHTSFIGTRLKVGTIKHDVPKVEYFWTTDKLHLVVFYNQESALKLIDLYGLGPDAFVKSVDNSFVRC